MHNWEEINALHDLPKWNASSVKIEAGRRYRLLSSEGEALDQTDYTLTNVKEGKAVLEDQEGFSFRVDFDALDNLPAQKDEPLQQWSSKEIEVSTEEAKRVSNELAAKHAAISKPWDRPPEEPIAKWLEDKMDVPAEQAQEQAKGIAAQIGERQGQYIHTVTVDLNQMEDTSTEQINEMLKDGAIIRLDEKGQAQVNLEAMVAFTEKTAQEVADYKLLEALHSYNLNPSYRNRRAYTSAREIQYTAQDMLEFAKL